MCMCVVYHQEHNLIDSLFYILKKYSILAEYSIVLKQKYFTRNIVLKLFFVLITDVSIIQSPVLLIRVPTKALYFFLL